MIDSGGGCITCDITFRTFWNPSFKLGEDRILRRLILDLQRLGHVGVGLLFSATNTDTSVSIMDNMSGHDCVLRSLTADQRS